MAKTVLIHSCYDVSAGEACPSVCACRLRGDVNQAKRMVGEGIAEWVTDGKRTFHNAVCLIGGMSRRTPRAATIDSKHIFRAYVRGSLEEQERINEYGDLSRKLILDLIRYVPEHTFDAMKKTGIDVPVLQFTEDNRTPGGVSEENGK